MCKSSASMHDEQDKPAAHQLAVHVLGQSSGKQAPMLSRLLCSQSAP